MKDAYDIYEPQAPADFLSVVTDTLEQAVELSARVEGYVELLLGPVPTGVDGAERKEPDGLLPTLQRKSERTTQRIRAAKEALARLERGFGMPGPRTMPTEAARNGY